MSRTKGRLDSLDLDVAWLKEEVQRLGRRLHVQCGEWYWRPTVTFPGGGAIGFARCAVCGRLDFDENLVKRAMPGGQLAYAHADCGLHVQLVPRDKVLFEVKEQEK